nr:hypothetical protein [Chitinophaga niastensis]
MKNSILLSGITTPWQALHAKKGEHGHAGLWSALPDSLFDVVVALISSVQQPSSALQGMPDNTST